MTAMGRVRALYVVRCADRAAAERLAAEIALEQTVEVPEELVTQPDELRRAYLAALAEFNDRLEDVCRRNRIERVLVDTSRDMGQVFVDYLNQRSRLNRGR